MEVDKEKIKNDLKISQQSHILEEICESGEIQYNCTACRRTFRSRSQKYYHLNCDQLQNLIYNCEHCGKRFSRHSQLKYHIESHLSPVNECHKCNKTFSNPLALKKHLNLHEVEPKLCPHCDKTFKKKSSLQQHIASQHLNQLEYGCVHCSKKYASKSSLQLHLQTHEKKKFKCTFCGKSFQRNSILNLHLKRHNNTNYCICQVCQKVFSESGALARHRKIHEENVVQYTCKLCDKTMLRKDNMTRHINTIHPEEKFNAIVEITSPSNANSSEDSNVKNSIAEKNVNENELRKPNEPKKIENIMESVEQPLTNQIKVITAVPVYTKETIVTEWAKDTTQHETVIHQKHVERQRFENCHETLTSKLDSRQMQTDFLERSDTLQSYSTTSHDKIIHQIKEHESIKYQENSYHHNPENNLLHDDTAAIIQNQWCIHNLPKTHTISPVIRSIGNVKQNLTAHIETPTKQPLNQNSAEYKHKKYSRNRYNIDLYRKILGFDENDNEDDNFEEDKHPHPIEVDTQSEDNLLKTTTPVHWRKSFKNNYETSSS